MNNQSLSKALKNNNNIFINSSPRNSNNNSINNIKKGRDDYANSPSFGITGSNTTNLSKNISLEKNNHKNNNELFRDSKELNKKFEQIQRRRKKNHFFNANVGIFPCNNSVENHKIKNSEESNDLNEIKKYIQEIKKYKNSNRNTVSKENKNNHNLIKLSKNDKNINNISEEKYSKEKIIKKNNSNSRNNNNKNLNINIINNNNNKRYKIMKVNINNNLLNKTSKDNNKKYKIIYYKTRNNHKNIIYFSKKLNSLYSSQPIIVKNITTKDKLINIHINYYFINRKKKPSYMRYNFLKQAKNFSVSIYGGNNMDKNELKINLKLSAIQEEDFSIQNSKIYDENDTMQILESTKLLQFCEMVNNLILRRYKKNLIYNMKTIKLVYKINNILNNKKDDDIKEKNEYVPNKINNNYLKMNKNTKIYSKKKGIKKNKLEENINNNKYKKEKNIYYKIVENKIEQLRKRIINYALYFCNKK